MEQVMRRLGCLLLGISLAGCTAIPVSSMLALSRIDFATTKFESLRVAVELPSAIEARDGGVHMDVSYSLGPVSDKLVFNLAEDVAQIGLRGLLPFPAEGKHIRAYRLRDEDVAALYKLRRDLEAKKQTGQKGSLSLGISAKEFCRRGPLDGKQLEVTTFVATSETKGYVVLLKDYDLQSDKQVRESLKQMPPCGN
jgi:hypothetical protein